jgi:hypothetical protein
MVIIIKTTALFFEEKIQKTIRKTLEIIKKEILMIKN